MEVNINTFGSVMESWTRDQMNNGWVITEQDTAEEMAISKQVSK
jgi:hypothetical protein